MIRYIDSKDIDKKKWDDCIRSSRQPSIFAYSWYLDTVCIHWGALIQNDYEVVFPFAFNKKFGIHYVYQPFFTRYFGIYSKTGEVHDRLEQFLKMIPSFFKYVKLCFDSERTYILPGYSTKSRNYQVLELVQPYEELKKNFSDNTKRNIKKALKAELKVKSGISPEQIVNLFKVTKGEELDVFRAEDYERLNKLMRTCLEQKRGETIAVYDEGKVCAAAFFMYSDNRFVFLKSGVTEEGRRKGAMHLLMDHFIQTHCAENSILDFGGSSVESVARFYKNFGARDCVYLQIEKKNLLRLLKCIRSFKF